MILELAKFASFLLSLLSLLPVLMTAFFEPDTSWQERMTHGLAKLAIAACVCVASGLLFTWPVRSNPEADRPLVSTLPVKLLLWSAPCLALLFAAAWYLRCGGQNSFSVKHDCF